MDRETAVRDPNEHEGEYTIAGEEAFVADDGTTIAEGVIADSPEQIRQDKGEPLVHEDEETAHGWGDRRTWTILIGLAVWLVVSTLVILAIVGRGRLTRWNLGWPPTSPKVITLYPGPPPSGL